MLVVSPGASFLRDRVARSSYDAVVVGSGPNGLAAAIEMARNGRSTLLVEAEACVGGAARTMELTLPGFHHDFGSAIHPLGLASPFLRSVPLTQYGLQWIHPPAPLAHPMDDGSVVMLEPTVEETAAGLGVDGAAYTHLIGPFVAGWQKLVRDTLGPLRPPRYPLASARFGWYGLRPARALAQSQFEGKAARAIVAGVAAHSFLPLERMPSAGFALTLMMLAHSVGWPLPREGSQSISNAMASFFQQCGGEIITGARVESVEDLPPARAFLCDLTARQFARVARRCLPPGYRRALERYRYGPGVFKLDYALAGPIPWRAPECARAGTVHLGGTLDDISRSEAEVAAGRHPERPFVLLTQPSIFDPTRAPAGKHIAWAYCHVPNGSTVDMTGCIEAQIERYAPGFKDLVLARHILAPADLQRRDANLVGGDINGGVQDLRQLYTRPVVRINPYTTPARDLYICSSSTPPGGGVHGLCGYFAARAALRRT